MNRHPALVKIRPVVFTGDYLDAPWLDGQPAEAETEHLRHITLGNPLYIALNERKTPRVVIKPPL